jgi:probable F420-dependent oxidoreductase
VSTDRVPAVHVRPPGWTGSDAAAFAALVAWAQRAEALGFDGLFVGDRLLAEASQAGQIVYGASMLDAVVVLSALAARTERLRIGPLVLVLPYRHPLQVAKTIASLDAVSDGRVVLGAGVGWNRREFAALGLPMAHRGQRFEEDLDIVRRLWRGEGLTDPSRGWDDVRITPLPRQPGGPPVWFASFSPGDALDWGGRLPAAAVPVLDRAGRLADGWVPLVYSASGRRRLDPEVLGAAWHHVVDRALLAGRRRDAIDFVFSDWCYVMGGSGDLEQCRRALSGFFSGSWEDALRTYTIGTVDEVVAAIQAHTVHIDRVDAYVLTPLGDDPGQLDLLAEVAARLRARRSSCA